MKITTVSSGGRITPTPLRTAPRNDFHAAEAAESLLVGAVFIVFVILANSDLLASHSKIGSVGEKDRNRDRGGSRFLFADKEKR
jgi:hypothetical protein